MGVGSIVGPHGLDVAGNAHQVVGVNGMDNHAAVQILVGCGEEILHVVDLQASFLGYLAAVISARVTYFTHGGVQSKLSLLIPLFILALPLFDTAMVVVIRTLNKKPFWIGDHNHISHRFVRMGLSRPRAVLLVHLLALCIGMGMLPVYWGSIPTATVVVIQAVLMLLIITVLQLALSEKPDARE